MGRAIIFCWLAAVILVAVWVATVYGGCLPTNAPSRFVASVPPQARVTVNAEGRIMSIFNTTDGTAGVRPSILNVYCNGMKIAITPQIAQELDMVSSKIDWRREGVVYDSSSK